MTTRFLLALSVLSLACGDKEEEGIPCGDTTCGDGEFCLTEQEDDVETEVCADLPEGCEDANHMCFDDPDVCGDVHWSEVICPEATATACVGFGESVTVSCGYTGTTTTY